MLDATGKRLLRFLGPDHPAELRCAAARVLGELGLRDAEVARAVCDGLGDPDAAVRAALVAVAGQLRVQPALPQLLRKVAGGGAESEVAAQAAARPGARGTHALHEPPPQGAPGPPPRLP